jgi:acyl-coenzyme A synthetase/AMP-(fatty) acid ligase
LRILPTGDLVLLRQDGLLQVIGRRDRQVKIRGQRVEPAEVEDALRRVPGVADAAVAARRDREETTLLAFIVADDPGDSALLSRARSAARRVLPNYMLPARVVLVERLPLLPGGKVDDQALLAIEAAMPWRARSLARAWSRGLAQLRRLRGG